MRCLESLQWHILGIAALLVGVLGGVFSLISGTRHRGSKRHPPTPFDGSQPDHPVRRRSFQGPPSTLTLGCRILRTRVFRSVELKDHPLRIRNARNRNARQGVGCRPPRAEGLRRQYYLPVARAAAAMITAAETAGRPSTTRAPTRAGLASCRAATSFSASTTRIAHSLFSKGTKLPASANVCRQAQGYAAVLA